MPIVKEVLFYETGGPEVLRLEDVAIGKPRDDEALVAIEAVGVNRAEAAFRAGHYVVNATLPSRLGAEAVGRILKLGRDVRKFSEGDRVLILPTFRQGACGI